MFRKDRPGRRDAVGVAAEATSLGEKQYELKAMPFCPCSFKRSFIHPRARRRVAISQVVGDRSLRC